MRERERGKEAADIDRISKNVGIFIIYTGSRFGSPVQTLEPETEPEQPVFLKMNRTEPINSKKPEKNRLDRFGSSVRFGSLVFCPPLVRTIGVR